MSGQAMQLHAALIWGGEPIADVMLAKPGPITIGPVADATFTVPDLGLPDEFAIVSPGERGYLLTMGNAMSGTVSIGGVRKLVTDLVGEAPFAATPVGAGDWGVVDLDGAGTLQLFFQIAPATQPLENKRTLDLDTVLPAVAFSVLLHVFLLVATFAIESGESPFVWPGSRSLTGQYLATRIQPAIAPPPMQVRPVVAPPSHEPPAPPVEQQDDPPRKDRTHDDGREGEEGDPPRGHEVGLNSRKAREMIDDMLGSDVDWKKWLKPGTGRGKQGTGPGSGLGILPSNPDGEKSGVGHKKQGKLDTKKGAHKRPAGPGGPGTSPELDVPRDEDVELDEGSSLDAREINKRIVKRRGVFGACYQRALNHDDQLGGTLKARFRIGPDGRVASVKFSSSTIKSPEVKRCVERNLRSIVFPTSDSGAIVNYPFAFTGGGR
jgi:hypothetical protein